jgi:hypothetical protein
MKGVEALKLGWQSVVANHFHPSPWLHPEKALLDQPPPWIAWHPGLAGHVLLQKGLPRKPETNFYYVHRIIPLKVLLKRQQTAAQEAQREEDRLRDQLNSTSLEKLESERDLIQLLRRRQAKVTQAYSRMLESTLDEAEFTRQLSLRVLSKEIIDHSRRLKKALTNES